MDSNGFDSVTMQRYSLALNILQKISACASTIGCCMIISQVTRSKINRSMPQQRIMLGSTIASLISSIVYMFNDLFFPGQLLIPSSGTTTTKPCTASAFLLQLGSSIGVIYHASLQLQYVLVIKYGWRESRIRKLEPYLHLVPIVFGFGTSIAGLILKLYNPSDWNCWIAPFPSNCTSSYWVNKFEPDMTETDCVRGDVSVWYC